MAALVYGLSQADNGTSHWGAANVIAALAAGVVLLAAFAVIETRSRHALLPVRLLRNSGRVGANLTMLGVGHRGLDGGGQQRPRGHGGPGGLVADRRRAGGGIPARADGRLRPGVPGRAAVCVLMLVVAVMVIRVRRADLAGC